MRYKSLVIVALVSLLVGGCGVTEETRSVDFFELCEKGSLKEIAEAIKNGADVNARGNRLDTPLTYAISKRRDINVIKELIKGGADVNIKASGMETALDYAVRYSNDIELLRLLIDAGSNVNSRSNANKTVLMTAAEWNSNVEFIEELVKAGADVKAKDRMDKTALLYAVNSNSNVEVVKKLIEAELDLRDIDSRGSTALHLASGQKYIEVFRFVLRQKFDVNGRGQYGITPLMNAVSLEIMQELIDAGAEVDAKNDHGQTVLLRKSSCPKVVELLLKYGADINARDNQGRSPLMFAAMQRANPDGVSYLIEKKAEVNAVDNEDRTALMHLVNVRFVIDDLGDEDNIKLSVLSYMPALGEDILKIARILVNGGVNIKAVDENGKTAWDYAAESQSMKDTKLLVELEKLISGSN